MTYNFNLIYIEILDFTYAKIFFLSTVQVNGPHYIKIENNNVFIKCHYLMFY